MSETNNYPKLHNATWPGVVGKGPDTPEPIIGLDTMIDLTAAADVGGVTFDGVDLFLCAPHVDIDSTDETWRNWRASCGRRTWWPVRWWRPCGPLQAGGRPWVTRRSGSGS